jgi:predicted O-methyltransferase YrrM
MKPCKCDLPMGDLMNTVHEIIYNICKGSYPAFQSFLEIGVGDGEFASRMAEHFRVVGVDFAGDANKCSGSEAHWEKPEALSDLVELHLDGSDDFFKLNEEKFDAIFVDGAHEAKQVIRDFDNSIKCLEDNGVIFLHDTCPSGPYFLASKYSHTSHEVIEHIDRNHPELKYVNLPDWSAGLTIAHKKENRFSQIPEWKQVRSRYGYRT